MRLLKTRRNARPTLARNIITRRQALKWSQADLAEKADLSPNTIKNIELGLSKGTAPTQERIAAALKCSVDDLHQKWQNISQAKLAEMLADCLKRNEELEAQIERLTKR